MKSFEEEINEKGKIVFTNVGNSMYPLIRQDKDIMIIEKATGRLKKYDVPLYKRDDGKYVLHRILKVRKNDYVICGDHCYVKEYGITDTKIIGVLKSVIRNGKEVKTTDFKYRVYTHLWCDCFYIRAFILRSVNFVRRMKNR